MENIGTIVLATGALGTAAFGIVEALKWTRVGYAGFSKLKSMLQPIWGALGIAYGKHFEEVLRGQYKGDQGELSRTLRQGVRIGLTATNAEEISTWLGLKHTQRMREVAAKLEAGTEITDEDRNMLGRFELAIDARIDAALTLAQNQYAGKLRFGASCLALLIALAVGFYLNMVFLAIIIGISAVPLAPIAKDLSSALQAAIQAMRR